jgi:hypothetical protein
MDRRRDHEVTDKEIRSDISPIEEKYSVIDMIIGNTIGYIVGIILFGVYNYIRVH